MIQPLLTSCISPPSLSASSPDTSHNARLLLTSWLLLRWFFAQLKFHSRYNIQFSKRNQHANDSVFIKSKNIQNQSMVTEVRKWESQRAWLEMGMRDFLGQGKHSRSYFWLVATQMCAIVKTYQTGYLTSVHFLHINNTFKKKSGHHSLQEAFLVLPRLYLSLHWGSLTPAHISAITNST